MINLFKKIYMSLFFLGVSLGWSAEAFFHLFDHLKTQFKTTNNIHYTEFSSHHEKDIKVYLKDSYSSFLKKFKSGLNPGWVVWGVVGKEVYETLEYFSKIPAVHNFFEAERKFPKAVASIQDDSRRLLEFHNEVSRQYNTKVNNLGNHALVHSPQLIVAEAEKCIKTQKYYPTPGNEYGCTNLAIATGYLFKQQREYQKST